LETKGKYMSSNEMIVLLKPGQTLKVQMADEQGNLADGEFYINYGPDTLNVQTDWADNEGRTGVIYSEKINVFNDPDDIDCQAAEVIKAQ
jgi:hypothetical protein